MRGMLNCNKAVFESDNYFDFPVIQPIRKKIDISEYIDFPTFRSLRKYQRDLKNVHFYCDDYKFECIWKNPEVYRDMLVSCNNIIMPDFSLYYDFPVALQIYNKFRNHWLADYYSVNGATVIPNISASTSDMYDWSFLGYPKKSVVAFCAIGSLRNVTCREILCNMYNEMIKRLEPIQILYFTRSKKLAPSECDVIEIPFYKGVI